jgi:hypothetical protein
VVDHIAEAELMSSSPVVDLDPAARRFIEEVSRGAAAVPDSIAGLLLKLAARVTSLERIVGSIALPGLDPSPSCKTAPGIEGRNDGAVGPERDSAPARPAPHAGRPKGRVDSQSRYVPRQRTGGIWPHREDHEIEVAHIVDRDWDRG